MGTAREGETDSALEEVMEAKALSGLKVHFISLVESPANKRQFLVKQAALDGGVEIVEKTVHIAKSDSKRRVAYGIVLAPDEVDDEQDTISKEEIEKAAYAFMLAGRSQQVDSDHDGEAGKGFVAESWLVRSGDPLFAEESEGAWTVGIKVTDTETWERVEQGELTGFSVAGLARRTPVEAGINEEEGAMAEQVEKGPSQEAVEAAGPDASEDLDAAAEGFVSRVVAGLKWHFGSGGEAVEKAADKASETPGSSPGQALDDDAGEVNKEQPDVVAFESVEKGFKEKMLRQQLWSITSALSDAVRDVLEDDALADKVADVREVVQEFQDWLEEQVGTAVSKEEGESMTENEGEETPAAVVKEDRQDERLAEVQQTLEDLAARLEVVEKQHPGRQTDLGGGDAEPVQKANGKGYRGLPISI